MTTANPEVIDNLNYVNRLDALKIFGIASKTLYNWVEKGFIKTTKNSQNKILYCIDKKPEPSNIVETIIDNTNTTKNLLIDRQNYVSGKEACKILGVHTRTLYNWEADGKIDTIRTPGNKRLYNVQKYLTGQKPLIQEIINSDKDNHNNEELDLDYLDNIVNRLDICYIRVSSRSQRDDLERQRLEMKRHYPNHIILEDIGSGLNLNKRSIRKIIRLAIGGKINTLVVAYRDRLTRFGFELIEDLVKDYSNGQVVVLNEAEVIGPEEELVKDVMAIMNVYVAKMNGLRKYNKDKEN